MDTIVIEYLQKIQNPFLDQFFSIVTALADRWTFLLLFCILYWCFDKRIGFLLGTALLFTSAVNSVIKEYFKDPRPFQVLDIRAIAIETADGYSFPSGHTQTAATFVTLLSLRHSKKWIFPAILITVLIALSRVYLGVHWPKDVIYGIVVGMAVAGLAFFIQTYSNEWFAAFSLLFLCFAFYLSPLEINSDFLSAFSALAGVLSGRIFEAVFVNFGPARTVSAAIGRVFFGLSVTGASFISLYYFFHSYPAVYLGVTAFVATGLIPLAYEKEMKKYS